MRTYVDSSVVLRHILSGNQALNGLGISDEVGSSDLLVIECQRVLQRERMAAQLDDQQYALSIDLLTTILERLYLIEMGPAIKRRAAGPFPTVIGTLDAIHLASAILWGEAGPGSEVRILTHNKQLALCARSLGIRAA